MNRKTSNISKFPRRTEIEFAQFKKWYDAGNNPLPQSDGNDRTY